VTIEDVCKLAIFAGAPSKDGPPLLSHRDPMAARAGKGQGTVLRQPGETRLPTCLMVG
jgi:hypothetical protein